ncbi:hypothetical protein FEM48_Zijuj12G0053100 [Ziziphus jujuba var. spinosa]|uniref:Uncharacterized protein n=1 Tax=Ziziphus jujuba var. spinosa TaxID=714518 RepID=A0A978UBE2_ZIZJJ|nr:hypothetical protein FEM48_Zijuj12G0053100 [Ziziphus jujuba var. spinosa]
MDISNNNVFLKPIVISTTTITRVDRNQAKHNEGKIFLLWPISSWTLGWPMVGTLLDLGKMPHRALSELRCKYERTRSCVYEHDFHKISLALAAYSSRWGVLRSQLVTVWHVSQQDINETALIRQNVLWIEEEPRKMRQGQGLHVTRFGFLMTFNQ